MRAPAYVNVFFEGTFALKEGQHRRGNPYAPGTPERGWWRDGWLWQLHEEMTKKKAARRLGDYAAWPPEHGQNR